MHTTMCNPVQKDIHLKLICFLFLVFDLFLSVLKKFLNTRKSVMLRLKTSSKISQESSFFVKATSLPKTSKVEPDFHIAMYAISNPIKRGRFCFFSNIFLTH